MRHSKHNHYHEKTDVKKNMGIKLSGRKPDDAPGDRIEAPAKTTTSFRTLREKEKERENK